MTSTKEYWRQKKRSQKLAFDNADRMTKSKRSPFQRKLHDDAGALFRAGLLLVMGVVFVFAQPSSEMFGMLAFFALLAFGQSLITFWEVLFPPKRKLEKPADAESPKGAGCAEVSSVAEGPYQIAGKKRALSMKNLPWAQIIFFVSGLALILITALNSDYLDEPRALMTGGGFLLLTGLALRALSIWQSK